MENKSFKKGISLAEVVISIFVISVTSTAAYIMSSLSIRAQIVGQDYSIAVNLAREGIEVVRGIRDSNWLYYSGSKRAGSGNPGRDHWNDGFDGIDSFGTDYNEIATGVGSHLTDDQNFTIDQVTNYFIPALNYSSGDLNERYRWKLQFIGTTLTTQYPLDAEYLVYQTSPADNELYVQTVSQTTPVGGKETKFHRIIEISYQESYDQGGNCKPDDADSDGKIDEDPLGDYDGDGINDDDGDGSTDEDGFHADCKLNANDNIVLVRSKVTWLDTNGKTLHVELMTTLTDWYRREDHT